MGLKGNWVTVKPTGTGQGWQEAKFTTNDQREKVPPIQVAASRFAGQSSDVALIVGGIHGNELTGVQVADRLIKTLQAAKTPPALTTIVIPQLFADGRFRLDRAKDPTRYILGEKSLYAQQGQHSMDIEPNRNLPRVGESYADVRARLARHGVELIDYYDRTFDYMTSKLDAILADMMLAENRILVQLIEQEKPTRAASLHGKTAYARLGDGPGIFMDPRGGFSPQTDHPWTKEGELDDELTRRMIDTALAAIPASVLAKLTQKARNLKMKPVNALHPFAGNLLDPKRGLLAVKQGTVHYTVSSHARGASLGMWGSADELHQEGTARRRAAMPIVTVEMARIENQPDVLIDPILRCLLKDFLSP
jgi:hypothetical protein